MINWDIEHIDNFGVFASLMNMEFEMLLREYVNLCKMMNFYKYDEKYKNAFEVSPIHCTISDWISMYQSVIAERVVIDVLGDEVEAPL